MARKILLADDSVTAQNMGRRILSDAGYEVVTVNNGSAALKKIAEHKPDLIILDVYMPGYGGLEVCQRLKEARETARIPVLLTVGKLEPFKPEEARRVKADAYLVKPFEASELLTALTRLEDKIVPQPESYKPGRFAKAIAAVEESVGRGEGFGDQESGWKDRLTIPHPGSKPTASEPEVTPVVSTGFRDLGRPEDFTPAEPKRGFERPIPAGLPSDITLEEIAAITAAAAAFGNPTAPPPFPTVSTVPEESHPPADTVSKSEAASSRAEQDYSPADEPTESSASEPAATETAEEPAATFASGTQIDAVAEAPSAAPETVAENHLAEAAAPKTEPRSEPEAAVTTETAGAAHTDAEVLAAVASLGTPGLDLTLQTATASVAIPELAAIGAAVTGPRWIAESVPLADDESTFVLEREMEKAYAAFAAADAARAVFAAATVEIAQPAGSVEHSPLAQANSAVAMPESPVAAAAELKSEEPTAPVTPVAEPMTNAVAESAAASQTAASAPEAAYAATASAGSGTTESSRVETTLPATPSERAPSTIEEEFDRQREAELAAAWQNWKHIRQSILGSQVASSPVEAESNETQSPETSPAKTKTEAEPEPPAAAAPAEPPSAAATDSDAISSIVDNMLAELKPKLMEEIAKKLHKS